MQQEEHAAEQRPLSPLRSIKLSNLTRRLSTRPSRPSILAQDDADSFDSPRSTPSGMFSGMRRGSTPLAHAHAQSPRVDQEAVASPPLDLGALGVPRAPPVVPGPFLRRVSPSTSSLQRQKDAPAATPAVPSFFPGMLGDVVLSGHARPRSRAASSRLAIPGDLLAQTTLQLSPSTDCINMFGPLQVTSNYSLSGKVYVQVPCAAFDDHMELLSLRVCLCGYSMYVDSSSRYSAIRICNAEHAVVTRPVQLALTEQSVCYELGFDVFAPGWLPASFASRNASTFYSLEAVASLGKRARPASAASSDDHFVNAIETLDPSARENSVCVRSAPHLIRVQRSRELVPVPVALHAIFEGEEVQAETNPFLRARPSMNAFLSTNPFSSAAPSTSARAPEPPLKFKAQPRVPLRHYTHLPKVPLPVPVVIQGKVHDHLPLKITLSVPAHTNTYVLGGEEQPSLVFGLQVELHPLWEQTKMWSDMRLCELEAMCVQMEKYSTALSRSYCTAFALPSHEPPLDPDLIPEFDQEACANHPGYVTYHGMPQYPYNRTLLQTRHQLEQAGMAPVDKRNHADRFRSYTVGPLPQREHDAKGKKRSVSAPAVEPPAPAPASLKRGATQKRKKAYTNAFSRLSMLASAIRDAGEGSERNASSGSIPPQETQAAPGHENPKASYVFDGRDGFGMALGVKRTKLSFNLPLVPSAAKDAQGMGSPQLLPDYESPHVRIRHKLKVKLRFGYGSSQLSINAGTQSLVMCVPVRFSEAPAKEALAFSSPIVFPPSAHTCMPAEGAPSVPVPPLVTQATRPVHATNAQKSFLPAYVQLFRDDGSRLADETEVLPRYPERNGVPMPEAVAASDPFSLHLETVLRLAPDHVREAKTGAVMNMTEALNADDDLFDEAEPALHVDDDMLDTEIQQDALTSAPGMDYDIEVVDLGPT
ncbi:hypothetical protein MVES1_000198 [Malassezia vespertilionis]|uniref:Uncharacterized protein n=1 Tax=Malassezia vespertilionis TaxID=2020962 RepID=A0A2N1JH45_9BASI|nr:uncharacterized protein MVES1_000198 [Malassezia vespertilionis]PKI85859.1 hypothetical protein MVES_000190 [Malassezia vespertilionis]WFD04874.1 hypothetical protein MVES1_000198 [Malassezia vespertilionis]